MYNKIIIQFLTFCLLFILPSCVPSNTHHHPCKSITPCKCQRESGEIIDLTSFKNKNFTAKYADKSGVVSNFIYYPCGQTSDFDSKVCLAKDDNSVCGTANSVTYVFGRLATAEFSTPNPQDNATTLVNYKGLGQDSAAVYLRCSTKMTSFKVTNFQNNEAVALELITSEICPKHVPTKSPNANANAPQITFNLTNPGDSYVLIGLLSIIISFCLFSFLYFIISMVVRNVKGTSLHGIWGKDFLCDIPYLIKDGFLCVCSCIPRARRLIGQRKRDYVPIIINNA